MALDDIPEVKKAKKFTKAEKQEAKSFDKLIETQNTAFFNNRDFVKDKMPKSNWLQLLEVNRQEVPKIDNEVIKTDYTDNYYFLVLLSRLK